MPSPIVHFQIAAADPDAAAQFFREVFEWETGPGARSIAATIDTGAAKVIPNDIHVQGSILKLPEGAAPFTGVFVRVADLDATLAKAIERGAKVILPRSDPPGGGPTVAIFAAPTGHTFGLVQL
jgi:predicted enzyme related to lactoylglutathione lyase